MRDAENSYRILVEMPLGKWSLRRLRKWKSNIKMDVRDISCGNGR
jgi:hypothetical protein